MESYLDIIRIDPIKIQTAQDIKQIQNVDIFIILARYEKNKILDNGDRTNLAAVLIKYLLTYNTNRV